MGRSWPLMDTVSCWALVPATSVTSCDRPSFTAAKSAGVIWSARFKPPGSPELTTLVYTRFAPTPSICANAYCFPVSAIVTTRTIDALPIMTPSMVRAARILLARRACMASFHVSPQNADVSRALAIRINAKVYLRHKDPGLQPKTNPPKKGRFMAKTFLAARAALARPCFWAPSVAQRDTVRLPRRVCPGPHRVCPAICVRLHGKASHCVPGCLRDRPLDPRLQPASSHWPARRRRHDRRQAADRWVPPAPQIGRQFGHRLLGSEPRRNRRPQSRGRPCLVERKGPGELR